MHRTTPSITLLLSALCAVLCAGHEAHARIFVSELLASTASTDCEFIELRNTGSKEVDLKGWSIELWDSDADKAFGTHDADSPIKLAGRIDAGGTFLLANEEFGEHFEITPDQRLKNNAIENSSFTLVLRDDLGEIIETIFVSDGGADDKPNINGRVIEPDAEIRSPDGRYIPPGFARMPDDADGNRVYRLLKFSPVPSPGATPGRPNTEAGTPGQAKPEAVDDPDHDPVPDADADAD